MPKLIIDEQEIEVPAGTKVIEAAEELGIMIPRFCYHPALGSVGACRVCAVIMYEGPVKGIQMSCMIDAQDGMVVSTTDDEVVDFREQVIEWLMLNHPHDCPVCDEGGHCLLQDMTFASDHWVRGYDVKKRTHYDQFMGPLIQHEMNRCIQCYRCSRYYQEYAGFRDLGVMGIGSRVYFGRYKEGALESPFAGNLIDICPTGVYTDRPSRFKGRRWEFERSPSVCINCSLGCRVVVSARYREIVRQEAQFSETVNGYFICDRGRYGFSYASERERPRHGRIDGREATWKESLQTAVERLDRIGEESGPSALACVGSTRSSLETQAALRRLCQWKGWGAPTYWMNQSKAQKVRAAVSGLTRDLAVSMRELEEADFILAVGADPVNEAPMLALAMRQAESRGAKVVVLDPRPISLPFAFQHLPVAPSAMGQFLGLLAKGSLERDNVKALGQKALEYYDAIPSPEQNTASNGNLVKAVAQDLRQRQRPVIVCGTGEAVPQTLPSLVTDNALLLKAAKKQPGLFYVLTGANAFGAAMLSDTEASFEQILEDIEAAKIRGLVLVETDPFWHFPDGQRLKRALERLDLLVVLDYVSSATAQAAHVFLPTLTLYEAGGIFINHEGRGQLAHVAYGGGLPLAQFSGGSHPPRLIKADIPGGEARAAWHTMAILAGTPEKKESEEIRAELMKWLVENHPPFEPLLPINEIPDEGVRLSQGEDIDIHFENKWSSQVKSGLKPTDGLELVTVDWTFGTEELSSYSPYLRKVERAPCLFMQGDDAAKLGLADGDSVVIRSDQGTVQVDLRVVENMAAGIVVMPRHRQLAWQQLKAGRIHLRENQILKVPAKEQRTIESHE